jgi:hypothetical protein
VTCAAGADFWITARGHRGWAENDRSRRLLIADISSENRGCLQWQARKALRCNGRENKENGDCAGSAEVSNVWLLA